AQGGAHTEAIDTRTQVAEESLSAVARIHPGVSQPIQFVAKTDSLRRGEARRRIVDLHILGQRWQYDLAGRRGCSTIPRQLLDDHGWQRCRWGYGPRINHLQNRIIGKPDAPVRRMGGTRNHAAGTGLDSIEHIQNRHPRTNRWIAPPTLQLGVAQLDGAA